jgi:hypothetical protein
VEVGVDAEVRHLVHREVAVQAEVTITYPVRQELPDKDSQVVTVEPMVVRTTMVAVVAVPVPLDKVQLLG